MNVVVLAGRLTRDPEIRAVGDDNKVAKFGLALDGIKKDQVDFVDVETWGKSADIVEKFFKKGSFILVNGRLKQDSWEKDGQKNTKVFVVAERVEFGPKDKTDGGGESSSGGDSKPASSGKSGGGSRRSVPVDDEDIF